MVKKIMTLESMVESLHAELAELGSSDTLTRAKQQHESVVNSMRQKFDADILAANGKIDSLTKKLSEKVTYCIMLILVIDFCYSVSSCIADCDSNRCSVIAKKFESFHRTEKLIVSIILNFRFP